MGRISLDVTLKRVEGLLATELDGELVLMSVEQGAYYGMEKTARRIWDLLETPQTADTLCRMLSDEYSIDRETCQRDVLPFVEQLVQEGLVIVA